VPRAVDRVGDELENRPVRIRGEAVQMLRLLCGHHESRRFRDSLAPKPLISTISSLG
jgi:hypothetical protein